MADKRLQFDLSERRIKDIEKMMDKCDIATRKELFNNALTIFEWAIDEISQGNEIASINRKENSFSALRMPVLQHAKPE